MPVVVPSRDFRLLLLGEVISLVGDRALRIALPFFVYQQTGSIVATAALAATFYLPGLLFASFAGVLADRWDRRRILVVSHALQAAVILGLLLTPNSGWLWTAYAVMFAELTISVLAMPAAAALIPSLVTDEDLPRANALLSTGSILARLVGPLVGGALIGVTGLHGVILFDCLTFLLAAAVFARLAPTDRRADAQVGRVSLVESWRDMTREWREGLRLVPRHQVLLGLFVTMNVTSLGGSLVDPFWVPFVTDRLQAGPGGLGLLSTTIALGALLGGMVAAWLGGKLPPRWSVGLVTVLVGFLMITAYHQTVFEVALALLFLLGVPLVVSSVAAATLLQRSTPDRYRGRVYGALGTTNALMGVLAVTFAGVAGEVVGVVPMLTVAGGLTVLAGFTGLLLLPGVSGTAGREAQEGAA